MCRYTNFTFVLFGNFPPADNNSSKNNSLRCSAFQSVEKGETSCEAAKTSPLAARFAHQLVFAALLFVSPFSTDWNAELRRLQKQAKTKQKLQK